MQLSLKLRVFYKHPSGLLLAAQVLAVMLYPLMEGIQAGRAAFGVFGNLVLALALWVVFRSPLVNWIGWMLAVPAVTISLVALLGGYTGLLVIAYLLETALYFYAAIGLIAHMLADPEVTIDDLLAAGATFTLLAWAFAFAYSVCQYFVPGSFGTTPDLLEQRSWLELLFLSFSILSGVGLSDITPAAPMARSLVMLEMFSGVMYIAIVVSRLIAMVGRRRQKIGK
jgi:hypothetical protein